MKAQVAADVHSIVSSDQLVTRFLDKGKFERVAAGRCSGEFSFAAFNCVFGTKFDHAGLGSVIGLPR